MDLYWTLLVPAFVISIMTEFFQLPDGAPNMNKVIKRLIISVLLLMSFDWTINAIAVVGDGVAEKIDGIKPLWAALQEIGQKFSDDSQGGWFEVRSTIVYILGLLSYFIAYLGVFTANALIHFVWTILYIASPLMILAYVHEKSAYVTSSLYNGLINVILWKIVASILGVLMLKLITSNQVGDDWGTSFSFIAINLCVGLSLLFVPMTTKSLLGDGLGQMASGLAMAPAYAALGATKVAAKATLGKTKAAAIFAPRPVTNYVEGKTRPFRDKISNAKKKWENMNRLPRKKEKPNMPKGNA
ncbi:MAG: hypothetical protein K2X47_16125 [Bdellovibrionales bacterium]|nr:hypothetical protein [Bdellovibrionales bacterium]